MSVSVVFYYLKAPQHNGKLRLTCNLANTAFNRGHKVYISAENTGVCETLDSLLWTFAPNSFLPHTLHNHAEPIDLDRFPVVVGHTPPSEQFDDILISLNPDVQDFAGQFKRVIEPVDTTEQDQATAQSKFNRYADLFGTEPTKHYL